MKTTPAFDLSNPDPTAAARPRRALNRRGPAPLALEPRVMFDGATADAAVAAAKAAVADIPAERAVEPAPVEQDTHVAAAVLPADGQRQEIVFIEDNVPDYQKLAAAVQPGVEVVVLDHTKDGLQQMIAALDGHAPVDALHLVTHGANAQIDLGSNRLSIDSLDANAAQLAALGRALAAGGDILVYGCDVAGSESGTAFVTRMAQLTGADVAASTDISGSKAFGGNWTLETQAGIVDAQAIELDRAGWSGQLDTTVFDAEQRQLKFNTAIRVSGSTSAPGSQAGDVVRFTNVIEIDGQQINAEITTALENSTISDYDSKTAPASGTDYFQPNLKVGKGTGAAVFTVKFYLPNGTPVTLKNVVVNSYDIDGRGSGYTDLQFQEFRGFTSYQVADNTELATRVQSDGSVRFEYAPKSSPVNSTTLTDNRYRVQVFYDSMSSFQIRTGATQVNDGTAQFSLDFQLHEWGVAKVGSPAPKLSYGSTTLTETAANDGAVGSTTITLSGTNAGGTPATFAGTNGQALDVSIANLPAGLSAQVIRASDTTATLVISGNALAHENLNDVGNLTVVFKDGAFASRKADAVTGASRADLKIDFNSDDIAPVVAAGQVFDYPENRGADAGAIGTVAASDDSGVTGFRFANAGGTGSATSADGWFAIDDGGNITLTPAGQAAGAASNDYEIVPNGFTYAIQARDRAGNWSNAADVTLILRNVEDVAPAFGSGTTATPLENQPVLYTATATDAVDFTNGAVTYGLKAGVGDADLLTIDAGGVVRLASGNLDFETRRAYSFTVTARDDSGNQSERAVTVTVGDVDEVAPTVIIIGGGGVINAGQTRTLTFIFSEDVGTSFTQDDVTVDSGTIGPLAKASPTEYVAVYTPAHGIEATDVQLRIAAGKVTDLAGNANRDPGRLTLSVDTAAPRIGGPGNADGFSSQLSVPEGTTALHTFTASEGVTWSLAGGEDVDRFTITPSGALAFRSAPDYEQPQDGPANGANTYLVRVCAVDAAGNASLQEVTVTVTNVNEAPLAADGAITTAEDTVKTGTLPPATDLDRDTVTYAMATGPAHGTVTIEADGRYTYTPAADYHGADSFQYSVSDGNGGSNTYTVAVDVTPVNDAPVAGGTRITVEEDTPASGTLPVATDAEHEPVTYSKAGDPAHGTVTITPAGGYTYTPAADYNGSDSFRYTVSDGHGGSNTYTVAVTVNAVNDAPVAAHDTITTAEDTVKTGTLPPATDIEHDAVTYAKAGDPAHGTVSIAADGSYRYTPAANYNGSDSFRYMVSDGHGGSNTYTIGVTVTPVNDAPVASGTRITVEEDTPASGTLPVATDVEHEPVTYSKAGDPAHGTVTITPVGGYTYTPAADYNGSDSFRYTVSDGHGGSNTYTVEVTVNAVNDAPVAADDAITTAEDTAKTGTLPAATDLDRDTVTYAMATGPAHGTVTIEADGRYTYTPAADYHGADSFQYSVSDGNGGSNTYTVAVDVTPVNDAPVAGGTRITVEEDTPASGTLPVATDAEHEPVTYSKAGDPAHGTVTITPAGGYTYTPATDYNGSDSFRYTVSDGHGGSNTYTVAVTVNAVNDAPVAAHDAITTAEDTVKTGTLPPATDIEHDAVTYAKAGDPAHGTVSISADGSYRYTPAANYNGSDSFRYTVSDGHGGSNTYTIGVTVTPVNDAPVAGGTRITVEEDTPASGTLPVATDAEHEPVTYSKAGDPAHGTVSIDADGRYTYTPAADYNGSDSFQYSISDGHGGSNTYTVDVTVGAANDAPVAANAAITMAEDTVKTGTLPVATDIEHDTVTYAKAGDPAHGTVSIDADGRYTYTPAANYNGSDSFRYTVSDGQGGSNTYTIEVTVTPVNDAPVAGDTRITAEEDTPVSGTLPAATDAEREPVSYTRATDPAHGSVTIEADGRYTYTPAADYHGADSFRYTVSDGHGGSNTYTVEVTVNAVNDAPVAADGRITTAEDTAQTGTLPAATDIDHDAVTYARAAGPAHGTVTIEADGRYTYTPAADYHGADSFRYSVSDGRGGSNTYTVAIDVTPVNDAPVALDTAIATREDTPVSGSLPATRDADGDRVAYTLAGAPAHGSVVMEADGRYTYTPAADYHGADSFQYTVSDGKGGSNTHTVTVTVDAVNDAPVAHGGAAGHGTVGEPMAPLGIPAFTDVDGPAMTYTATLADGSPLPSWLAFDPVTLTFTGTPPRGSLGTHDVVVSGSDGALGATARVSIAIGNPPVPNQPVTIDTMTKDSGVSATDFITGDGSAGRSVSGSIGAPLGHNEAVQVSFDGGATWTLATTSGTSWSATDNGAHAGNWTIEARVTNLAAGLDGSTATREVVLDTVVPAAPTVDNLSTTSTTPVLHGSASVGAGEILRVTIDGATYEVAAANGSWSLDLAGATPVSGNAALLTVGRNYDVTATITDLAGNVRSGANTGLVSVSPPLPAPEVPAPVQPVAPITVSAPAPMPVAEPAPVNQAADTRVRSESAPGSLAAGDSQQLGYGIGTRAGEQPVLDLRGAALSDIYTRTEGFRTVVAKAEEPALVLFQGVPDQFAESGHNLSMTVPADAFAHTQPNATVRLVAVLQDGRPLPTWVQFNSQTGQFTGDVPKGLVGELKIKLIARDLGGREATALFRINVGQQRAGQNDAARSTGELRAPAGKAGLSAQLRARSAARG